MQGGKPCESIPCAENSGTVFRRILSGLAREELRFDQLPVGGMCLKRRKCQAVKGLRVEIFMCPQTKVKILPIFRYRNMGRYSDFQDIPIH